MIESIKNLFLKSKLGKRSHGKEGTLNPMQSGLILFDGSDQKKRQEIIEWVKWISKQATIKFEILGYINQKQLSPELQSTFYGRDNINWYGLPKAECIDKAIKTHFDLCVILDSKMWPHQKYILSHLNATILAGFYTPENENVLDFMIEQKGDISSSKALDLLLKNLNKVAVK